MVVREKEECFFCQKKADQNQDDNGETRISTKEESNHILQPQPENLKSPTLENLLPVSRLDR